MPVTLLERRKATAFARALAAPDSVVDPASARLVRVAEELTTHRDDGSSPTDEFRVILRDRILAVAAARGSEAMRDRGESRYAADDPARTGRGRRWRRRLITTAVGISVTSAAAAGVAAASENALPGDWLYPVKRTVERAELVLPGDKAQRGQRYLDQANTRMWEIQQTLARSGSTPMTPQTVSELGVTLDSMRSSVQQGGELITSGFAPSSGDAGLRRLSSFINEQRAPVTALENELPQQLASRAPSLLDLFNQLGAQVTQLSRGTVSVPYLSAPARPPAARHPSQRPAVDNEHPDAPVGSAPAKGTGPDVTPNRGGQPATGPVATPSSGLIILPTPISSPAHTVPGLHMTIGGTPRKGSNDIELPPVLPGLPTIGIGIG